MKKLTFVFLFLISFGYSFSQALGESEIINPTANQDFKPKLSVSGDFDKGKFMVEYRLPIDSKKVEFRIVNPEGKLIVKEKNGSQSAGYHYFIYNIKNEPVGVYTFSISTKEGYSIKQKFEKKDKV